MALDLTLYTNPMSRGQIARWMLEEVGEDGFGFGGHGRRKEKGIYFLGFESAFAGTPLLAAAFFSS